MFELIKFLNISKGSQRHPLVLTDFLRPDYRLQEQAYKDSDSLERCAKDHPGDISKAPFLRREFKMEKFCHVYRILIVAEKQFRRLATMVFSLKMGNLGQTSAGFVELNA